ncbi:MAG: glycosyltransferase [Luteitalea sp.]|nr:glycosyltransferase [Luteitalea sp.]
MRSRVLFIDHVGTLGGGELSLIDVARAYRGTSTVVLLADGPFRERLAKEGIRVVVIDGGDALRAVRRETDWPGFRATSRALALGWRIAGLARQHDCLHANSQKAFVVACLAGVLAHRPVIWDLNDLLIPAHFSRTNIRIDVALANYVARRVIANSQASAAAFVAQGGRQDKVRVVYNGIASDAFDAVTEADVEAVRRELQLDGKPLVGLFGRLGEWKGQDVALEAMCHLPDVRLLLVGDALFGEERYRAALRTQVTRLGLTDRVRFLGFRSDVPRLMRLVQAVLHTSKAPEPFGRVIVEGMLAERPVVATRAGGVEEILEDGVTGILVSPGDPVELATAVRDLLANPQRANELGKAARRSAKARFSVDTMVRGMTEYMEEVVYS